MKILVTGGSGLLGSEIIEVLKKQTIDYYAPTKAECDITDINNVSKIINNYNPNIIIHCAAIAKFKDVEKAPKKGLLTNIIGTNNIIYHCIDTNIKLVFISSSHVFDGSKGNYNIEDKVNPLTKYSKTKVAGEYSCLIHDNSLVIRTEFCGRSFPFDTAYTDKWSSKEYVDILAPKIVAASISNETGIHHIAGERKSFYDFAKTRNNKIKKGSINEIKQKSNIPILVDTSLENSYI